MGFRVSGFCVWGLRGRVCVAFVPQTLTSDL